MKIVKRSAGILIAVLIGLGTIAIPTAANAAVPTCNGTATFALQSPAGPSGGFPSYNNTSPKSRTCNLWPGGNMYATVSLQDSLNHCNGANLAVDGAYGPATEQAVRNVQSRAGITVDGVYGPQTMNAMRWWNSVGCYSASSFSYSGTNG